ncbi:hypothetical protein [uncultured Erythrobacter sp.]|uniref:hypothetical protein n=1 Tax=uncultured Erythrobacter sp. TaxID=263913 RepID=UPI00260FE298|nr:hypothetical protein [uncultured Erythrobacter sp.]
MGLFGPSLPIDREELEWLLACFAWIDRTLGQRDQSDGFEPRLVLPNDEALTAASTASDLFHAVKQTAGLSDWECRLEKGEPRRERIQTGLAADYDPESSALGTFSVEGSTPVIRYDPALLRDPDALVSTFAHELAHLVIHSLGMPPGGEALEEHATDCMAVYLGFGVFLANSARNFSQFSDGAMHGWSSQTSGYLSENALVTALAIFEKRFATDGDAQGALKSYLKPVHRKAHKYFAKRYPQLAQELSQIDLKAWA